MTIAQTIVDTLARDQWSAITFRGGYAVPYGDKPRYLFEPGAEIDYKCNGEGRCTRAVFRYSDGSRILFTWTRKNGSTVIRARSIAPHCGA